ncbi:polysaccharide biosynthesis protein GtrA [Pseudaminobacter soli (ex Li et al. 2025)]|uniref:Polysaccharide biosynthesis protein GtrA n=1 Tax=Pseudaminobacter soli (ex Li et al. 2025) TaxID=1295366 RepID=A0A2P7SI81_9HYPH|nr:polysaccharide biosynthesis protein GtrA [Mesorhizobium soli]PSJ62199.1 polysaccharide biosynthesis protein GtrA [Mesorhizobium soli]
MSVFHSTGALQARRVSPALTDIAFALVATLLMLAVHAASGFRTLSDFGGDNDSLLRLVEVRDLLGGQGWFDLHQYRMGPQGGFVMHWSRFVDAPIAAIILAVTALGGSMAFAEAVAQVAWPGLLFGLTVFCILRSARLFGGERAVLPAAVIGAAALHFIGIFTPGALDHHNVQLLLTLASLYLLLIAPDNAAASLFSGVCAALMLAVGMETAPYVAVLGLCVGGLFLFAGEGERVVARNFGLGFAGVSAFVFFATIPATGRGEVQCDAFSVVHFVLAVLAGLGLAGVASSRFVCGRFGRRLAALGLLGVFMGLVAVAAFPQCLAAPYAELDPRLKENWLDHVQEARSLFQLVKEEPAVVVARYVTPLLGLLWLLGRLRREGWRRQDWLVGALLIVAFLVSVWQVRGSTFSITLATIPLSAWVANWRSRAEANPSFVVTARMAAVWLVSMNVAWTGVAAAATIALEGKSQQAAASQEAASACQRVDDYAVLASQPDVTVLAVSNLGSPILAYSRHRVFSGPYHRNIAGNLIALDAFMGSSEEARQIAEANGVGLVALCRGNAESRLLAALAPDGLLADLMRGTVPEWLEPMPESARQPLELYRVRLNR